MIRAILLTLLSITALALTDVERAELIAKNLMTNPGGERVTQGWANVGGTFTHTTTAAQVASGNAALNFDADASGDALDYTPVAIPQGAYKNVGVARCYFKGASAITHKFQVHDGTNILAEDDVTSSTDKFTATSLYFSFPNSGSVGLSIVAQADEAATYIDDCYIGLASGAGMSEVSQAELYTYATQAFTSASCSYSGGSDTLASFGADTDCAGFSADIGKGEAPATKILGWKYATLPPGRYKVTFAFPSNHDTNGGKCAFRINDGTDSKGATSIRYAATSDFIPTVTSAVFEYSTAQSDLTFELFYLEPDAGNCLVSLDAAYREASIIVEKLPTSSQTAFNFDNTSAFWTGYHDTDCSWSTTSSTYTDLSDDASCTFTERFLSLIHI